MTPLRIASLYALVAAAWILLSDRLLAAAVRDPAMRDGLQTVKGWAFVLVTAVVLYGLVRRGAADQRRLEQQVRATIDSMADAVLVVDRSARIVDANRSAVELLAADGKPDLLLPLAEFADRFHVRKSDGSPLAPDGLLSLRALAGETVRGSEAMLRRADGRDVFVGVSSAPVREGGHGAPGLAVTVLRDMSELKRFEEMRDEFLSTAAHEFKTPLAVIKAYAQLLQKREQAESPPLAVINRQVERLSRLVQQLLEVSRFRLGGRELRRERYDLGEQVRQVVERMRPRSGGHRLLVAERAPAPVLADRERIEQVIANLVDNAVKFSPRGGDIEAVVARHGAEAVVSIHDAGVGIPRERQARIFERYYRAHAGTAEDYGGIGVGLDMSREIVGRHGGRIWFESEPGVGSTFTFTLPLAETEA